MFWIITELTPWTPWTTCSKTCGSGEKTRKRECKYPDNRDSSPRYIHVLRKHILGFFDPLPYISIFLVLQISKNRHFLTPLPLPSAYVIYEWSPSNPCGNAALFEREICNPQKCPIYTEWSEWSKCSVSCGGGKQSKERSCVLPPISGNCTYV